MTKAAARQKQWREEFKATDPEGFLAYRREEYRKWAKKYPDKLVYKGRKCNLAQYGITPEQYDIMLEQQQGLCKVCGLPPSTERLAVDHNHETGQIRGLVHRNPCNIMIGYIEKYGHLTEAIQKYLAG